MVNTRTMSKEPVEKRYRSKETVTAYEFHDGMEDGVVIRYCDPREWEKAKAGGTTVSTWSVPTPSETMKVEVPFIFNDDGDNILVSHGNFVVRSRGRTFVMTKTEFLSQYEAIEE